jgi:hypothetical protein
VNRVAKKKCEAVRCHDKAIASVHMDGKKWGDLCTWHAKTAKMFLNEDVLATTERKIKGYQRNKGMAPDVTIIRAAVPGDVYG